MRLLLSRYACVRRDGGQLIAEGSAPGERAVLDDPRSLALIQALARPRELEEAAAELGLGVNEGLELARPLIAARVLVDPESGAREDASAWGFEDLRSHLRSRREGSAPFPMPRRRPPPALPGRRWSETLALPLPDLDAAERNDPPFAAVQAARRSVRRPGSQPLGLARLGEFLFRVGRVEDLWHFGGMSFAARPYPAAGALYELELYLAARQCESVEPGLYHYAAEHHQLARVPESSAAAGALLEAAMAGMGVVEAPHALVVIAARFERIAWKYDWLAYSLMLKDVGVVLQTMYLVATAMGLGACAVGSGGSDVFARATGLDPEEETPVGELCLSSR
jgi:oxazoline/thiazoline dehydrogenase